MKRLIHFKVEWRECGGYDNAKGIRVSEMADPYLGWYPQAYIMPRHYGAEFLHASVLCVNHLLQFRRH